MRTKQIAWGLGLGAGLLLFSAPSQALPGQYMGWKAMGVELVQYAAPQYQQGYDQGPAADIAGDLATAGGDLTNTINGILGTPTATGEAYQLCAERFRSFNPGTGTYTTYQGETRVCPYLR